MAPVFGALNLSRGQLQSMIYKKRAWLGALLFIISADCVASCLSSWKSAKAD